MLSWFLNPWMLAGGLAVASPILIHLLNKRRFKIVEWAAMDFLFEADKKNRRRVELENFILLMLRCLAMLLIALMLARPFLPSSVTSALQNTQQLERVLLVDDSMSQRVRRGTLTSFDATRESIKELVSRLAESDQTKDWLTVMLTSDPENPLLANEPVTANTVSTIHQTLDDMVCSDQAADYGASLDVLSRYVSGQREQGGRAVYLYSDLRRRDWDAAAGANPEQAANRKVDTIADGVEAFFVVDTGTDEDDNLTVVSVRPDSLLVAEKVIPFRVTVANHGDAAVEQLRVLLQVNEGQPEYETIPVIGPGETRDVTFRYVFSGQSDELLLEDELSLGTPRLPQTRNYRVRAEIDRQSLNDTAIAGDQLLEDSLAYYAARVADGISVLLVDGDPAAIRERSETHYLKSLEVAGTGLDMNVVTVTDLETISLSDYQVIFLCNVDEASPDRVRSLERWVSDGGSLVLMPGNRVRANTFNATFFKDGAGICPLELEAIMGDPTMSQWVNFEVAPQVHPALRLIVDSDVTSLSNVDIFSWWTSRMDEAQIGKSVEVPLRLTDDRGSPAMVDRSLGRGNVIVFAIPGDGDWSMWPISPTFPPVMIELIDYLIGSAGEESVLAIGGAIRYQVDITAFENRVALRDPNNEKVESVAAPQDADDGDAAEQVLYDVQFDDLNQRGFYELQLTRHTGEMETVLFAANVDPAEGRMKRVAASTLQDGFFGDQVSLVDPEALAKENVQGGNSEIWTQLLMLLFGVLLIEQFLGWHWGRKR